MYFTPVSDEQIAKEAEERKKKFAAWPRGTYEFQVIGAEDKISKVKPDGTGGNPMIELTLEIYNDAGETRTISDWLLESGAEKLKSFCKSVGLLETYNKGELNTSDALDKSGKLYLRVKKQAGYPDRNEVAGYAEAVKAEKLDDEIPF